VNTPEKLRAVAPLARAELARRRLVDFLELLAPGYVRAAHAGRLCERLEALERREITRLVVSMPPRHGKTLHVSQALPAWWLGRRPGDHVILASYGAELAESNSRRARGFLLSPSYPFETRVSAESAAVNRWGTTVGGGVIAAGVGGGVTGFGADLLVVDDPVRGREDADSDAVREATWRWFTEVALTRLQPGAVALLTMTRWHEDDVAGRVLRQGGWETLTLPAFAEEDDPLGRREGEALWPEWYGADALRARREEIGGRPFAALYQQRPAPAEGNLFKTSWLEGTYDRVPDGCRTVTAVDASFGKGVASDFSAVVTVASDGRFFYVVDAQRGRWDFNGLVSAIRGHASRHHPQAVLVEDAAAGQSAIQELRRMSDLPVVAVKPAGSKVARAEAVSGLFESGRVLFPEQAPAWRDMLLEELGAFPAGRHDDLVDALVYALGRLRRSGSGGGADAVVRKTTDRPMEPSAEEQIAAFHRAKAERERLRELRAAERSRIPLSAFDPRYE
jgi:predicted phage terminase large subunit-like protein